MFPLTEDRGLPHVLTLAHWQCFLEWQGLVIITQALPAGWQSIVGDYICSIISEYRRLDTLLQSQGYCLPRPAIF